jgi:hypothetical protein
MKLKPAIKYHLSDTIKPVAIFYGIVILLFVVFAIQIILSPATNSSMSGIDMATTIFLFVAGLNSYKTPLRLFVQNGLSRKTLVVSVALASLALTAFMTAADSLLSLAANLVIPYTILFQQFFAEWGSPAASFFTGFLWTFSRHLMAYMAGFFISALYYRMSRWLKIAVSVGVPSLLILLLLLPIETGVARFMGTVITWVIDTASNPYAGAGLSLAVAAVLWGLSWALNRRVTVRDS